MDDVLSVLRWFRHLIKGILPQSVLRAYRRLRRSTKQALPSSVRQTLDDFQYIDTPADSEGSRLQSKGISIVRSHYWPRQKVYFFPERPLAGSITEARVYRGAVAYTLCRLLGYGIVTNSHDRHDVAFKYERSTFSDELSDQPVQTDHVINGRSTDISKRTVNTTFEDVFGYSLGVDPRTYDDSIVVKSIINAAHDGSVVEGPLSPKEVDSDNAYQRVIDNTVDGEDVVLDYRVPVHGESIPVVFLKYRPTDSRFDSKSTRSTYEDPTEVFSQDERKKIVEFAQCMGIDFGEFDVLRDNDDGRIYIVDANSVPWGLPRGMNEQDRKRSLMRLSRSFQRLIERYANHQDPTTAPLPFDRRSEDGSLRSGETEVSPHHGPNR